MKVLVLGMGNILMRDDGLGPRTVARLEELFRFPLEVELLDGGTLSLDLLPRLEGKDRLLIIDAVNLEAPPGAVRRLTGKDVPWALAGKISIHQTGVMDLLAVAELQGCLPAELVIWGVRPARVDPGLELSPEVQSAIPRVIDGVVRDLSRWGRSPRKRG